MAAILKKWPLKNSAHTFANFLNLILKEGKSTKNILFLFTVTELLEMTQLSWMSRITKYIATEDDNIISHSLQVLVIGMADFSECRHW